MDSLRKDCVRQCRLVFNNHSLEERRPAVVSQKLGPRRLNPWKWEEVRPQPDDWGGYRVT